MSIVTSIFVDVTHLIYFCAKYVDVTTHFSETLPQISLFQLEGVTNKIAEEKCDVLLEAYGV